MIGSVVFIDISETNIEPKLNLLFMTWSSRSSYSLLAMNGLQLEGVVANRVDSTFAYVAANQLSGVFSVFNTLRVEHGE
jgi:hypothetical protein